MFFYEKVSGEVQQVECCLIIVYFKSLVNIFLRRKKKIFSTQKKSCKISYIFVITGVLWSFFLTLSFFFPFYCRYNLYMYVGQYAASSNEPIVGERVLEVGRQLDVYVYIHLYIYIYIYLQREKKPK